VLGQIYSYIYLASAYMRVAQHDDALAAVKQALDLATPDKVYMPFVENCDYIKPVLAILQFHISYQEHILVILGLYKAYQKSVAQIIKVYQDDNKPALAEREIEIALLAAEGFSNKEIGETLFITANTVKTTLKRVFEKLEINSRALLKTYFDEQSVN
jgi:LuxR family maltose regulon positive regulatory protein